MGSSGRTATATTTDAHQRTSQPREDQNVPDRSARGTVLANQLQVAEVDGDPGELAKDEVGSRR